MELGLVREEKSLSREENISQEILKNMIWLWPSLFKICSKTFKRVRSCL